MSAVPHGNESVVVVGDGGLLTWGLAFYLKAAGWQRVSLVGAAGAPRESAHARGVVDVHPPRLHRYDNIASSLQHYWFGALSYVKGTQLPPEHMRFAPGAWTDPSLLHWMSRMVFYTRETCLDAADVSAARLLQMQHRLLGELRPQLASALGTTEEKTAPVVSSSVTDMFLERSSFSEHRYRLVMHGKEGLKYDIDASKASSLASEAFPTFYRLKQHIRGTVRYASSPTYDLQALTASLREYCGVKFAGSVQRIPSDVASFSTESLSTVDPVSQKAQSMLLVNGVTLDDGSHIPCSAVVFANGGGIRRLLHAAGCYVLPPVYEAKAVFLDVNATREYMTGGIPERSVNIEHDVFLTRRDGSDKITRQLRTDCPPGDAEGGCHAVHHRAGKIRCSQQICIPAGADIRGRSGPHSRRPPPHRAHQPQGQVHDTPFQCLRLRRARPCRRQRRTLLSQAARRHDRRRDPCYPRRTLPARPLLAQRLSATTTTTTTAPPSTLKTTAPPHDTMPPHLFGDITLPSGVAVCGA